MKILKRQNGFTLVEMAFVLLIMGLIVGSVFAFYSPQVDQKRIQLTIDRQNKIARALSYFALINGVLPCPGQPNPGAVNIGDPRNGGCNGATASTRDGIVPFRALGLSQEDATDGYGNPFTYSVSKLAANLSTSVHRQCRLDTGANPWVINVPPFTNVNPNKAIFCCQRLNVAANHIEVWNNAGMTTRASTTQDENPPSAGDFSNVNNNTSTPVAATLGYFAYILVSHGKNGEGSYRWPELNPVQYYPNRKTLTANASNADTENADSDTDFVDLPRSGTAGATTYVDDIVLWRTQQGVIAELGNDSCARP